MNLEVDDLVEEAIWQYLTLPGVANAHYRSSSARAIQNVLYGSEFPS